MTTIAAGLSGFPLGAAPRSEAAGFAIEILTDVEAAEPAWREIEREAVMAPYGRFDWLAAYLSEMGDGAEIRVAVVRDGCLGRRWPGLLEVLGARDGDDGVAAGHGDRHDRVVEVGVDQRRGVRHGAHEGEPKPGLERDAQPVRDVAHLVVRQRGGSSEVVGDAVEIGCQIHDAIMTPS